ncbi:zinc metallopeptidase [Roseomonas sp. NAR14]|uniref:Zinc metallopeptidase n=1 Tax=Roseomonas acroporae TaxID=2937791 RepID=A0A9X2BVK7_9PROT|nr:neutral zinc metallopeptidase [Roseomonas acroporae]MCK8782850.1 zinc metallopeptidase [Roseomonas acroporae]
MRLEGERESGNVEDRRGAGGFSRGGIVPIGGGLGGLAILLIALFLGVDPRVLLPGDEPAPQTQQVDRRAPPGSAPGQQQGGGTEDPARRFVAQILGSTEDVWKDVFRQAGRQYRDPTLVLYSGMTQSGCGTAQAQVGPFYCPLDQKLYIDLGFFREMQERLGAPGDFARAYVIAHEVGHHVQNQLGTLQRVDELRQRVDRADSNALSVRVELQADCYAGVWAARANAERNILEQGDIEQGMNAASAVGDDRLQRRSQGYAVPESFTHGSSAQRVNWFRRGLQSGDPRQCDTFGAQSL